jgi:nucleoside-diphosphate-sugar epimerase
MTNEQILLLRNNCDTSFKGVNNSLDELRSQSILITGGTGFIGKWLAESVVFLNEKYDYKIKLYLLARNIELFKVNFPHFGRYKYIKLIEQDVRHISEMPADISYVIHAATSPDNREHISQPLRTIDTIYKGTNAVLEACWRLPKLIKILYISSNNIYGEAIGSPQGIDESTIGIVDCNSVSAAYSEAKRIGETICAVYKNQQRLPIIIVRPFTFIGPYQSLEKPWAINSFIRDAMLGGPIRILGNENNVRSYLYGSDMAFWLLKIASSGNSGTTYNLGGKVPVSMLELARKIANNFFEKIDIQIKSSKGLNQKLTNSMPNINRIEKDLNVKQQISLEEAILNTINFIKIGKDKNI